MSHFGDLDQLTAKQQLKRVCVQCEVRCIVEVKEEEIKQ